MDCDVLIVGAGPAGTAAAWRLRSAGLSVLLIDRQAEPAAKPCAGGLTIKTLALMPYSVAPVIERVATGLRLGRTGPDGDHASYFGHDAPICAFSVRRAFDRLNLAKVREAGAGFEVAAVEEIAAGPDGVEVRGSGRRFRARYLIGADGANSIVRRLTGEAPWFARGVALEGIVPYSAIGEAPPMELLFGEVAGGYGWLFPKGDHVNVGLYVSDARVSLSKAALLAYARRRLGSDRVEDMRGYPLGFGGAYYRPIAPRVLLAGDAGGFAEPLLGEGIHNAVKTGQAAADAILDAEAGRAASPAPAYRRRLAPVRRDLRRCDTLARRVLYPHVARLVPGGMRVPPFRSAFLRGFAAGQTTRTITDLWPFAGFFRPALPASLREL